MFTVNIVYVIIEYVIYGLFRFWLFIVGSYYLSEAGECDMEL